MGVEDRKIARREVKISTKLDGEFCFMDVIFLKLQDQRSEQVSQLITEWICHLLQEQSRVQKVWVDRIDNAPLFLLRQGVAADCQLMKYLWTECDFFRQGSQQRRILLQQFPSRRWPYIVQVVRARAAEVRTARILCKTQLGKAAAGSVGLHIAIDSAIPARIHPRAGAKAARLGTELGGRRGRVRGRGKVGGPRRRERTAAPCPKDMPQARGGGQALTNRRASDKHTWCASDDNCWWW